MEQKESDAIVVISSRADVRHLADIVRWASANGINFTSRGELIRAIVEMFRDAIVKKLDGKETQSVEEAIEILYAHGISFPSGDRNARRLARAVSQERNLEINPPISNEAFKKALEALDETKDAPLSNFFDLMRKEAEPDDKKEH